MARPNMIKMTTYKHRKGTMSVTVCLIKRMKITDFSKIRSQLMNTIPMRNA